MSKLSLALIFLIVGALLMGLVTIFILPLTGSSSGEHAHAASSQPPALLSGSPANDASRPSSLQAMASPSIHQPPPVPPEILERLNNPEARARVAARTKADVEMMYADILEGLTPEDGGKMVAAVVGEQVTRGERALRQGPPRSPEEMQQEINASEQRLRDAMGESLFQVYSQGRSSLRQRRMARDFSAAAASSDMPLTMEQAASLVKTLVQEKGTTLTAAQPILGDKPRPGSSAGEALPNSATSSAVVSSSNERVIDRAREFLSPEQIGALRHFLSAQPRHPAIPRP